MDQKAAGTMKHEGRAGLPSSEDVMKRLALFFIRLVWLLLVLLCAFMLGVILTRVAAGLESQAPAHLEIKPPQRLAAQGAPQASPQQVQADNRNSPAEERPVTGPCQGENYLREADSAQTEQAPVAASDE
jgi:hypothetical protein